ncbi:hypothetical protein XBFFL1_140021 [Xenorhabdus bovienii str. feltiae Florida]|uniref:Uncharacterized protein n=1 Tax=Xenorhabdus bovienii str. feltiae Moldova TaxID=1398200 RepID=A0A077NYI3_XENBV|nr:hypothetical protein XBFFL1_140021 [Xenorhabdus bovienii str. feltiae Florida]CDH03623.1 hypothetical protein XBFM1_820038 [Xenorhabdus bovienii str. feltiae Moldova]
MFFYPPADIDGIVEYQQMIG